MLFYIMKPLDDSRLMASLIFNLFMFIAVIQFFSQNSRNFPIQNSEEFLHKKSSTIQTFGFSV